MRTITLQEVQILRTDVDVLNLPSEFLCEDKETLKVVTDKLRECHITPYVNDLKVTT